MLPIIICIVLFIAYIAFVFFKGGFMNEVAKFLMIIFSSLIAILVNIPVAAFISNNIKFIKLDNDLGILLGVELLYYRTIAFVLVFGLLFFMLISIYNAKAKKSSFIISLNLSQKLAKFKLLIAAVNGFLFLYVLIMIFIATPYRITYDSSVITAIYNAPILNDTIGSVSYDYIYVDKLLTSQAGEDPTDVNLFLLEDLEVSGYLQVEDMKKILNNFDEYDKEIQEYLNG